MLVRFDLLTKREVSLSGVCEWLGVSEWVGGVIQQ